MNSNSHNPAKFIMPRSPLKAVPLPNSQSTLYPTEQSTRIINHATFVRDTSPTKFNLVQFNSGSGGPTSQENTQASVAPYSRGMSRENSQSQIRLSEIIRNERR